MSNDDFQPETDAGSGGDSGNRRVRIGAGASGFGQSRFYILANEAHDEALRLGHALVDTEHFLIALARYDKDISAKALLASGISLEALRSAAREMAPATAGTNHQEVRFTPQAKRVQDDAWAEAERLQHVTVGPEHLLLAILHQAAGFSSRLLDDVFRVDRKELRYQIFKLMRAGNELNLTN